MPLPFLKFFVSVDEKNGCRTSNNQIALNTASRAPTPRAPRCRGRTRPSSPACACLPRRRRMRGPAARPRPPPRAGARPSPPGRAASLPARRPDDRRGERDDQQHGERDCLPRRVHHAPHRERRGGRRATRRGRCRIRLSCAGRAPRSPCSWRRRPRAVVHRRLAGRAAWDGATGRPAAGREQPKFVHELERGTLQLARAGVEREVERGASRRRTPPRATHQHRCDIRVRIRRTMRPRGGIRLDAVGRVSAAASSAAEPASSNGRSPSRRRYTTPAAA